MSLARNILFFWPRFFKEAWYFRKYYKAVKSIESELNEEGLRVDWLGRVYTVLNLKEEAMQQPDVVQQSMVFQSLKPTNDILMKYGLSNDAFPTIKRLNERSFLVVLYPENEHFNLTSFVSNFVLLSVVATSLYFGFTLLA